MDSSRKNLIQWIIILASFNIILFILWNTYSFFNMFKNEERIKMKIWAEAQTTLNKAELDNTDVKLSFLIISNNMSIPIILTNESDSIMDIANMKDITIKDTLKLKKILADLKKENNPISMEYDEGKSNLLYYGDSPLLVKLKYYPLALVFVLITFAGIILIFYKDSKEATQNKLWTGMAKETAHQIGTPLSSLIGWIEVMKGEKMDPVMLSSIEEDVTRLQTIAYRFSKIGSTPVLENKDIIKETKESFLYLKTRFSNKIDFHFNAPNYEIQVMINPTLYSWTIENLMKNAIDAMKGRGKLIVTVLNTEKLVKIMVQDTGSGIPKNQFKSIFEPGFTTKKRGWGLGLSLAKRIIEEYHKGKIKVLQSEIGKGTTIQIVLSKITADKF